MALRPLLDASLVRCSRAASLLRPLASSRRASVVRRLLSSAAPSSRAALVAGMSSTNGVHASSYEYDLVVIGGGSGGLSAAKEATRVNPAARVLVLDLVQPSLHGTRWGLGGTCVNVGCIPKKLMHHAGTMGALMNKDAAQFGWQGVEGVKHDWPTMVHLITDYIKSLNFSYRSGLTGANVKFIEGYAQFVDAHSLKWEGRTGKQGSVTFDKALIASGGRPTYLDIPGRELAITSDDIFWSKKAPGKTLVIGAGYIALECASFMHHLGLDVSVMVRGEILRKMDTQAGQMIGELMERDGIRFIHPATPVEFSSAAKVSPPADAQQLRSGVWQLADSAPNTRTLLYASGAREVVDGSSGRSVWQFPGGPITVSYSHNTGDTSVRTEQFDTVLLAVGRQANVADLHLDKAGVAVVNGKVLVDAAERTTADNVYAIGDVAIGIPQHQPAQDLSLVAQYAVDRPELTPVAIEAGLHLARRLFGGSSALMQYQYVPTTVFTSPSEYAFVGLSEEQAERPPEHGGIGKDNVRVFWSRFGNIEISPLHPEYIEPRSSAFIGKRLWARRYAERKQLDWTEVTFDTEMNAYVVYSPDSAQPPVNARVTDKYRDDKGRLLYDIQLEDGDKEIKGVTNEQLELQSEYVAEASSVFVKANCLCKLICDSAHDNRVVGLHFLGPSAGEVVQGFALAVQMGATKRHFDSLVGIHPTAAEEFAVLEVEKSSDSTPLKKAGCGGGSCG